MAVVSLLVILKAPGLNLWLKVMFRLVYIGSLMCGVGKS